MSEYVSKSDQEQWFCDHCNKPLVMTTVRIAYLESAYPVDLPKCPHCGQVFVPENLALGRMAEVEKLLEDK